jgi:hypothetical protein
MEFCCCQIIIRKRNRGKRVDVDVRSETRKKKRRAPSFFIWILFASWFCDDAAALCLFSLPFSLPFFLSGSAKCELASSLHSQHDRWLYYPSGSWGLNFGRDSLQLRCQRPAADCFHHQLSRNAPIRLTQLLSGCGNGTGHPDIDKHPVPLLHRRMCTLLGFFLNNIWEMIPTKKKFLNLVS